MGRPAMRDEAEVMTTTTTTSLAPSAAPARGSLRRLGVASAYLVTGLPIAIAAFTVIVTGLSVGAGMVITLVGIPILVVTLYAARGFAALERRRLGWAVGDAVTSPGYRPRGAGARGWLVPLRDPQGWLDVAHGLLVLPVATFTFSIAVSWWASAAYGLTWPAYGWLLDRTNDPDSQDLPQLLGIDSYAGRSGLYVAIGVFAAVTLPFVIRGMAAMQTGLGRSLLASARITALQSRVETLTRSRTAAAEAEAAGLRRLERDLHDGPQQRLVRIAMDLNTVQRRLESDPDAAKPLVGEALDQTREAIAEIRALSRGIAPPVLTDRGLEAALAAAASRATVRVDLDVRLHDGERLPAPVENAAYFLVTEALTNVAKHASAGACQVVVQHDGTDPVVMVEDDGVGGAAVAKGHGLAGLADRLGVVDGTLSVDSPPGGPTRLVGRIPCG
jgi:signal transduction histidine kinase